MWVTQCGKAREYPDGYAARLVEQGKAAPAEPPRERAREAKRGRKDGSKGQGGK